MLAQRRLRRPSPQFLVAEAMMKLQSSKLIVALLCGTGAAAALADDTVTVHFAERPPYLKKQADGSPSGLVGTPAAEAFKNAGVAVQWVVTPNGDQPRLIEANGGKDCSLGFFKNPKREAVGLFTKPLYRDKPWAMLAKASFEPKHGATLEEVLGDKNNRLLIKEGASYGPYLDGVLSKLKPTVKTTSVEFNQMAPLIGKGEADMMFVSQEEATYFVKLAAMNATQIKLLTFPEVPKGDLRYVWCSKSVGSAVIDKLNQAINAPE